MAKKEPWAPVCSSLFLPASSPSQEKVVHPSRCSGQEPGRHFHSFHSATLNHLPVSPITSTFSEAQTILHPHPASSRPCACPHNTVSERSLIMLLDGLLSVLWVLSQKPRPPHVAKEPAQLSVALLSPCTSNLHWLWSQELSVPEQPSLIRSTHMCTCRHTHKPRHSDIHRGKEAHTQTQR